MKKRRVRLDRYLTDKEIEAFFAALTAARKARLEQVFMSYRETLIAKMHQVQRRTESVDEMRAMQ